MKLRKLSVNQFKRFTVPTQLGDLVDGLNLVVGPNELGKINPAGRTSSSAVRAL